MLVPFEPKRSRNFPKCLIKTSLRAYPRSQVNTGVSERFKYCFLTGTISDPALFWVKMKGKQKLSSLTGASWLSGRVSAQPKILPESLNPSLSAPARGSLASPAPQSCCYRYPPDRAPWRRPKAAVAPGNSYCLYFLSSRRRESARQFSAAPRAPGSSSPTP